MLGYLILILKVNMEYAGDGWLGYNRRFQMAAAGNPATNWAVIDIILWSLAFSGKARSFWCKHCFSLIHYSRDCEWGPESHAGQSLYIFLTIFTAAVTLADLP